MGTHVQAAENKTHHYLQPATDTTAKTPAPSLSAGAAGSLPVCDNRRLTAMESPGSQIPVLRPGQAESNTDAISQPGELRFQKAEKTAISNELTQALQRYIDANPKKHSKDLNKCCKHSAAIAQALTIKEHQVSWHTVPESPEALAETLNTLLQDHKKNKRSSLFRELTGLLSQDNTVLSSFLQIEKGKVILKESLPAQASEASHNPAPSRLSAEIASTTSANTPLASKPAETVTDTANHAPETDPHLPVDGNDAHHEVANISAEPLQRQLMEDEQRQAYYALRDILNGYIAGDPKKPGKDKHWQQLLKAKAQPNANLLDQCLVLKEKNRTARLGIPATATELQQVLDQLLSGFTGYHTRHPIKTSSLVDSVRAGIEQGSLGDLLTWNKSTNTVAVRNDAYAVNAAEKAEAFYQVEQERLALEEEINIANVKEEIDTLQASLPDLYKQAVMARKLQKLTEHQWPVSLISKRHFSSIEKIARPAPQENNPNQNLEALQLTRDALRQCQQALKNETALRLAQLPESSDLPPGLPRLKEGVNTQAIAEQALAIVSNWQQHTTHSPDKQAVLNTMRGELNEVIGLLTHIKDSFDNGAALAADAWPGALLAEKLWAFAGQLKPAFQLGPITIYSKEQKQWQAFMKGCLNHTPVLSKAQTRELAVNALSGANRKDLDQAEQMISESKATLSLDHFLSNSRPDYIELKSQAQGLIKDYENTEISAANSMKLLQLAIKARYLTTKLETQMVSKESLFHGTVGELTQTHEIIKLCHLAESKSKQLTKQIAIAAEQDKALHELLLFTYNNSEEPAMASINQLLSTLNHHRTTLQNVLYAMATALTHDIERAGSDKAAAKLMDTINRSCLSDYLHVDSATKTVTIRENSAATIEKTDVSVLLDKMKQGIQQKQPLSENFRGYLVALSETWPDTFTASKDPLLVTMKATDGGSLHQKVSVLPMKIMSTLWQTEIPYREIKHSQARQVIQQRLQTVFDNLSNDRFTLKKPKKLKLMTEAAEAIQAVKLTSPDFAGEVNEILDALCKKYEKTVPFYTLSEQTHLDALFRFRMSES